MRKKGFFKLLRRNAGYTIAELLMSTFIFSTMATSLYSLLSLSNIIVRTHDVQTRISYDGLQVLRTINRELTQTSYTTDRLVITTDGSGNSIIRFQIPVDYDDDGDVAASDLTKSIEWGAYDKLGNTAKGSGANPLSRWVRYSVSNGQLQREVLDSMLAADTSLTTVICNDVLSFTAVQNTTTITLTLTVSVTDTTGQAGATRTMQHAFTYQTNLRNAPT